MPDIAENASGARFIARNVWSFDGALEITVIIDTLKPIVQIAPRPKQCACCGATMKSGSHNSLHNPFARSSTGTRQPSTMKQAKFDREVQIETKKVEAEMKKMFRKLGL